MARQAKFRDDGTITDVPSKLGENPQLEKQLDLLQYPIDTANLARLEETKRKEGKDDDHRAQD